MKKRVYIETTVPSFLVETRAEPEMVARQRWTQQWWRKERSSYEVVSSVVVIEELSEGRHPNKEEALAAIVEVPLLPVVEEIEAVVETYIAEYVMPAEPRGDALHLALASYHHCHFLLTWNCRHLANANKFEHIRHVNAELGLFSPILTTPFGLLNLEDIQA